MGTSSNRTKGKDFELKEGRFRVDKTRRFLTARVVKH